MGTSSTALLRPTEFRLESGSFRDRSARVAFVGDRVFRLLSEDATNEWVSLAQTEFWRKCQHDGSVVRTFDAPSFEEASLDCGFLSAIEHRRIPILSWPWEWSFSMLQDAALAQLQLMQSALQDGWILKDATPLNFQFMGTQPVLIDTGSITRLQPGQAWEGYRQFCQMFLYPLMLQAWKRIDFQTWLRGSLEGISPKQFANLLSFRDYFRRGAMSHVWLHAVLQQSSQQQAVATSLQTQGFSREMIERNVQSLHRIVSQLTWKPSRSVWSNYNQEAPHVAADRATKERFVRAACQSQPLHTVWDLGCNQGHYSRVASEFADHVLAMDSDHLTIDQLYQALRKEQNTRVLPLVYNIADPSPSIGWRLEERRSLNERSKPQLILCLALIHHLVIGNNLLLSDVIKWLAEHQCDVILEWVDRSDPLVRQLLLNRADVFTDYSESKLREAIALHFEVQKEEPLPSGHRTLFHLKSLIH